MLKKTVLLIVAFLLISILPPGDVSAEETAPKNGWRFGAEIYLWGASIGGESARESDIDIDFSDLLDDLNMAAMGTIAVGKGRWSLLTDLIYLDAEDDLSGTLSIGGAPVGARIDMDVRSWVVTPVLAYRFLETQSVELNALAGARYLWLDADVEADIGSFKKTVSHSGSVWDGIIGVNGHVNLSKTWYLFGHLDIGTGETDLTWQGIGGLGYRFKRFDVNAGYRYLYWDFDDNKVFENLDISGPFAGIKFIL